MAEYVIIIEKAGNNYAAMVPDLPGCIGAADTIEELEELMREAVEFHIEGCGCTEKRSRHRVRVPRRSECLRRLVGSHLYHRPVEKCLHFFHIKLME